MAAQPSTGFLNGHFYADGSPTEDTEDCLGRITVGLTRSKKSLTIVVSPLDMIGLIGMAQVLLSYGIKVYAGAYRRGTGLTSMMTQDTKMPAKWNDGHQAQFSSACISPASGAGFPHVAVSTQGGSWSG